MMVQGTKVSSLNFSSFLLTSFPGGCRKDTRRKEVGGRGVELLNQKTCIEEEFKIAILTI